MIVEQGQGEYYLYRHTRLDNNQPFYIGIGSKHLKTNGLFINYNRAMCAYGRNKHWNNIVNKYNYKVEILLESDDYEFIKQKEIEFIALYGRYWQNGILANVEEGGDHIKKNNWSKITKDNIVPYNKGLKMSEETKKKISEKTKGRPSPLKGRKISEEHRQKLIKNGLERGISNKCRELAGKGQMRKIIQLSLEGNFIKEWESISEAAKNLKTSTGNINLVIKGKKKTIVGYVFVYKEDYNPTKEYSTESCRTSLKVGMYDSNMNLLVEYKNTRDASKKTNLGITKISRVCYYYRNIELGIKNITPRKTYKGFIWKFIK